jgi:hypothetical protein
MGRGNYEMSMALGIVGMLGFLACLVWLIVAAIRKRPKKNSLIGMLITFVAFVVGMANSQSFQTGAQAGINSTISSSSAIASATSNYQASSDSKATSRVPQSGKSETAKAELKEIYSDKLITAWFVKKYDVPYMPSMFYFTIKVENKTDKKITIYPQDSYVNDTTFTALGAESMDILPKKNRTHTFFGPYEGTGIKSADKIKKIGFKINITDENTHDIETTKTIEVKF